MRKPQILSLEYVVPSLPATQREVFDGIGYPKGWFRLFEEARIDRRYFILPVNQIKTLSFQQQQEMYATYASVLSLDVFIKTTECIDKKEIGLLSYNSCTGFAPGPTIGHHVADLASLKDVEVCNFSSMGCEGSMPGLRRCFDYTSLTGQPSVAIACELADLSYYPEDPLPDPENGYECLRANSIFGDGCSCALIGYDDNPRHPTILDFATVLDTKYINELGYVWRNGRLRVKLSRNVPKIAVELSVKSINKLLNNNKLKIDDIAYWIFHPPGAIVLDMWQEHFGFSDEKMQYSRYVLKNFGNMSSATVGVVGKKLMEFESNPKGYAVMVNVGPGMASNSVLLKFGG